VLQWFLAAEKKDAVDEAVYVDEVRRAISGYKFCGKKLSAEKEESSGENPKKH